MQRQVYIYIGNKIHTFANIHMNVLMYLRVIYCVCVCVTVFLFGIAFNTVFIIV